MAVVVAAGCGQSTADNVRHPIRDSLSVDTDEAVVVTRNGNVPASVAAFVGRLTSRKRVGHMGSFGGNSDSVFGSIVDLIFLTDSSVAVLDQQAVVVRVFHIDGHHLYTVGGSGKGPGEYEFPIAILSPYPDWFWVIDGARLAHRYNISNGHLQFVDRITLAGFAEDACTHHDGSIMLHAPAHVPGAFQTDVLFELDQGGRTNRSFAAPYRYEHRLVAKRLRRGKIACVDGVVLLAFDAQNRLDSYDKEDGGLRWHSVFEGVLIPPVIEQVQPDGRRAVTTAIREHSYFHALLGIAGAPGAPAIVQFALRDTEQVLSGNTDWEVETYAVDLATGRGAYVGDDLPQVLAINGDLIALLHLQLYPWIEIARLGAPSGPE